MSVEKKSPVYFCVFRLPKNLVDSQVMLWPTQKTAVAEIAESPEGAEVIIVNTCSFIQAAKEESIETILEMASFKEDGACKAPLSFLAACLSVTQKN